MQYSIGSFGVVVTTCICLPKQGPQGFTGPPGEPGEAGAAVSILNMEFME